MEQPLSSWECDDYQYEIHHPTKPLILCHGNKWLQNYKKALLFDTKDEAFRYLNSIRHKGKVMELYYIHNHYLGWSNSELNLREVKEKINTFV